LGGVVALWAPWAVVVAANWPLFSGQTLIYRGHFQLLSPGFYWRNLLEEGQRYFPNGQVSLAGALVLILFAPAVAVWLAWRFVRTHDNRQAWLWAPAIIFPLLFAGLVQQKNTSYAVSFIPVIALLVAYAGQRLLASRLVAVRAVTAVALVLIVGQGALGIGQLLQGAAQADAPGPFFAQLRQTVSAPGLILGPLKYSFPFEGRDYRAIEILYYLALTTSRQMSAPDSFEGALQTLRPRYVLMDEVIWQSLTETELAGSAGRNATFWDYLRQHGGELAAAMRDNNGHMVRVYQLEP
jgi:hypothetical protein